MQVNHPALLDAMTADEPKQSALYRAGPFWAEMSRDTTAKIRRSGLENFRGRTSLGFGFSDNVYVDVREPEEAPSLLDRLAMRSGAYRRLHALFEKQVDLAATHEQWFRNSLNAKLVRNPRASANLAAFRLADTVRFGCVDTVTVAGETHSRHYLKLLDQHAYAAEAIRFGQVRSMLELGGGFGANVHILLQNYPGIRKIFYVDIPPAMYVGTQYLRAIFGDAVRDYLNTRDATSIEFRDDDSLEIVCVPSWQIDRLGSPIDLFYNAHSFAEMPDASAQNYADAARRLLRPDTGQVAMLTYEAPEGSPILPKDRLPQLFPHITFEHFVRDGLDFGSRTFFYLTKVGAED